MSVHVALDDVTLNGSVAGLVRKAMQAVDRLYEHGHVEAAAWLDALLEDVLDGLDGVLDEFEAESWDWDDRSTGIEDYEADPTEPVTWAYWEPHMLTATE